MKPSIVIASLVVLIAWSTACSSGLGRNLPVTDPPPATIANANLQVGVDPGVTLAAPAQDPAVAGFVLPAFGDNPQREVALVAFASSAPADDADGSGGRLSRDGATDGNGASDVFLAAVSAQDVERRAFSQSLAGKFRHPRCTTCHSMQAATTTAFVSAAAGAPAEPHAGPPPGPGFPANDPSTCAACHLTATADPRATWQAPAASFDMRADTVAQLAQRATLIPTGEPNHFTSDERVLWALDSGILPGVGGRNGIADDDHDGVDEPEDRDGVRRTVPGGSAAFLREIGDWNASGRVVSCTRAVRDVTLVSRASGTAAAANGASQRPRVVFVPNPAFNPATPTAQPIGTAVIAYESLASNLAGVDGNGVSDVYVGRVQVVVVDDPTTPRADDGLALQALSAQTALASAINGTVTAGNGASTAAAIGGSGGEVVAFRSLATNLVAGFVDGNGAGGDVYVRRGGTLATQLVSHAIAGVTTGGNGDSAAPAVAANALAVAFDSAASDLVAGDGNGARDVFHAPLGAAAPFVKARSSVGAGGVEATGGDSRAPSVQVVGGTRVLVAYESAAANLAAGLLAADNVYLFDGATGGSTLLNQRVAPTGNAVGDAAASAPQVSPDGSRVAFLSAASNIDVVRANDENRAADVFVAEIAQLANGNVLPFRVSMTVSDGASADGASAAPAFAGFGAGTAFPSGLVAYRTSARNLGASDATDLVVSFLAETSGIIADFTADVLAGPGPLTVRFDDLSTGLPTSWEWDFQDDGVVDATAQDPTFVYAAPGLYAVRLTARNANSSDVRVRTGFVRVTGAVTAQFTAAPTTGSVPLNVVFGDQSTEDFGAVSGWAWDFDGDGTVDSTARNPSFTYVTAGTFTVRLTATGEFGSDVEEKAGFVVVAPPGPITAGFTTTVSGVNVTSAYSSTTVTFTSTTSGPTELLQWDFDNDPATIEATGSPVTRVFAGPTATTVFNVRLRASGFGNVDEEIRPLTIVPASESVTLESIADTSIYSLATGLSSGTSNGANPQMVCGRAYNPGAPPAIPAVDNGLRRALVRFPITGNVPGGSTILGASLQLSCTFDPILPTGPQSVTLQRLTRAWTEGTTNLGIGLGGAAAGGDATWLSATSGAAPVNWTSLGGDFSATISATTVVNAAGPYTWASTAAMTSNVQLWLNSPALNFGWVLRANEAALQRSAKVFGTHEDADPARRPRLTVTFRRPLP